MSYWFTPKIINKIFSNLDRLSVRMQNYIGRGGSQNKIWKRKLIHKEVCDRFLLNILAQALCLTLNVVNFCELLIKSLRLIGSIDYFLNDHYLVHGDISSAQRITHSHFLIPSKGQLSVAGGKTASRATWRGKGGRKQIACAIFSN